MSTLEKLPPAKVVLVYRPMGPSEPLGFVVLVGGNEVGAISLDEFDTASKQLTEMRQRRK